MECYCNSSFSLFPHKFSGKTMSIKEQTIDGTWKMFERTLSDPVEGKSSEKLTLTEICNRHQDLAP